MFRLRLFILIMVAIIAAVVVFYSASVRETAAPSEINAKSFNSVLQKKIKEKQNSKALVSERDERPMDEVISNAAASYGVNVTVTGATWQKAEVSVLQGGAEQLVDWLADLDVLHGIRIQNLHLLSDSGQEFVIDRLVLVR